MSGIRLAAAAALTVALAAPVVLDAPVPAPEPTYVRPGSSRMARAAAPVEPAAPVRLTGWDSAPDTTVPAAAEPMEADVAEPEPAVATRSLGSGVASYYGAELAGNRTASGERFDPTDLTAAHRTLPFGTRVEVTNPRTGDTVVVRINDRGPFHGARVIDLSHEAARRLGIARAGTGRVALAVAEG